MFVAFGVILVALTLQTTTADQDDDASFAMKYLTKYNYMPHVFARGNHDVPNAIAKFQRLVGIPATGKLNADTIRAMKRPRCGLPDNKRSSSRLRRYVVGQDKWTKSHIKYYVQHGEDLSHALQNQIFAKAFGMWANASTLTFSQVSTVPEADIRISFGKKSHVGLGNEGTCSDPFDGESGVLAHAVFPEAGICHFDEDETYTDGTPQGVNLLWVAVHEFGHNLGIDHSDVYGAVMYPMYTGYVENFKLHNDDIRAVQALYGAGAYGTPPPVATTQPSGTTQPPATTQPSGTTQPPATTQPSGCSDAVDYCQEVINDISDFCTYDGVASTDCRKSCGTCTA